MNKSADESAIENGGEISETPAAIKKGFRYYFRLTWPIEFLKGRWMWWIKPELYQWKLVILMHVPGRIGSFLRTRLMNFGACGRNVLIEDHVWLQRPESIIIGDDCRIHRLCYFDAVGGIEIGSHTGIGTGTQIYSVNHRYKDKSRLYNDQGYELGKVVIEEDVWIGSRVFIGAGVRIRKGTIVAASAVVTKDTEEYSVVAGVPAVKIGMRL